MAWIIVQYRRPSCSSWKESVWSSFGRTTMGKAIWENPIGTRLGKGFQLGMLVRTPWKGLLLSVYVDDIKLAGKKQNLDPMWKVLNKEVDLGEPTSFLDHVYLGCTQRQCEISKNTVDNYRTVFDSRISAEGSREITILSKSSCFFMVLWHGWSCKEMCGTILWVGKQDDSTTQQSIYSMHRWPFFQRRRIEICRRIVKSMVSKSSEMFVFGRIGRPDLLWSVIKSARSITKWKEACDKRLNRLISNIHHTCEYKQYCNTAKQCRLGLFQDSDFAGDLEDSKSTTGATLCVLGSHTFVPISWMCKKQTSVSHSSTESEIISLDSGLRLDGIPALELWDLIVSVLGNTIQTPERPGRPVVQEKDQRS